MKIALSLVVLASLLLSSCTTLANRRDLFSPKKAEGPAHRKLEKM